MKRATVVIALVVLAWTVWDTGADPVRLGRGIPWIADFLRRMLPPPSPEHPPHQLQHNPFRWMNCRVI